MGNSGESYLALVLIIAGGALMSFIALACHRWRNRLSGRHYILRFCMPILLISALFIVPLALTIFYALFGGDGYRLQAGEAPGPAGDLMGFFIPLLLWLFGVMLLLAYMIAAPRRQP